MLPGLQRRSRAQSGGATMRQWGAQQAKQEEGMAETKTAVANKPAWVDLASSDAAASRDFYSKLFGWKIEVNQDPQYGGYGVANVAGQQAAGIGPKQSPEAPTAWSLYIGTDDAQALARRGQKAGGKGIAPPLGGRD